MKLAICDKNKIDLQLLKDTINVFFNNANEIRSFNASIDLDLAISKGDFFDIYFINPNFDTISGLELASSIRKKDDFSPIVFMSNTKNYAYDAFQIGANFYILKPLTVEKINEVLKKITNKYINSTYTTFPVKTVEGIVNIKTDDLEVVECSCRKLIFHLVNGQFLSSVCIRKPFSQSIPFELTEEFQYSHNSFLVNLSNIVYFSKNIIKMKSGLEVPVSHRYYPHIKEAYKKYLLITKGVDLLS